MTQENTPAQSTPDPDDQPTTAPSTLPDDNGTPFESPDDVDPILGNAHQAADYTGNIDADELYNDGPGSASDAEEVA